MGNLAPLQIIDNLQHLGNLFPECHELRSEIRREGDKLVAIPVYEGRRMPMYFTFQAKDKNVRLRKTVYLHFLPKDIDVKQINSYCSSRLYFYRWMFGMNGLSTRFMQGWGMKVKEDRLGNCVLVFTAFCEPGTWEQFADDWHKFYNESSDFSTTLMIELHSHICSVLIDRTDGSVPLNLGPNRIQA